MSECISKNTEKPGFTIGEVARRFGQSYIEKYNPDYRTKMSPQPSHYLLPTAKLPIV